MKRLYLRFFDDSTKHVPVNSEFICSSFVSEASVATEIQTYGENIAQWMKQYPQGKTDFVWLS